jgi:hypothetical protein
MLRDEIIPAPIELDQRMIELVSNKLGRYGAYAINRRRPWFSGHCPIGWMPIDGSAAINRVYRCLTADPTRYDSLLVVHSLPSNLSIENIESGRCVII